MRTINAAHAVLLFLVVLGGIAYGNTRPPQRSKKTIDKNPSEPRSQITNPKLTELSASNHSTVAESYIFVARNLETYELLRARMSNLPAETVEFFQSHAVLVAFLGQRPTPGFGIEVTEERSVVKVMERRPPKGAMLQTVLTAPHKAVAIELGANEGLSLSLDETWKKRLRSYRLTSGELLISGGFAGKRERLALQGTIEVMQVEDLGTFVFQVSSSTPHNARRLSDVVSGKIGPLGEITLFPLEAFSLS